MALTNIYILPNPKFVPSIQISTIPLGSSIWIEHKYFGLSGSTTCSPSYCCLFRWMTLPSTKFPKLWTSILSLMQFFPLTPYPTNHKEPLHITSILPPKSLQPIQFIQTICSSPTLLLPFKCKLLLFLSWTATITFYLAAPDPLLPSLIYSPCRSLSGIFKIIIQSRHTS